MMVDKNVIDALVLEKDTIYKNGGLVKCEGVLRLIHIETSILEMLNQGKCHIREIMDAYRKENVLITNDDTVVIEYARVKADIEQKINVSLSILKVLTTFLEKLI